LPRFTSPSLLRVAVALCGVVPVAAGTAGIVWGPAMIDGHAAAIDVDSHFRYLSGLLLALGLGFWSTIPEIERTTTRFRLLTVLVLVGGFGRVISACIVGLPGGAMQAAIVMELIVTPLLCLWQSAVARGGMDRRD
jgi:hypothetical protein